MGRAPKSQRTRGQRDRLVDRDGSATPSAAGDHAGHVPVLLLEAVEALNPRSGGRYLDGTFGGGGHTQAILAASESDGIVLALDADVDAIKRGGALQADPTIGSRLRLAHANFADLANVAKVHGLAPLDGVLLDLGLSSFQLDAGDRGFAFRFEGPLDMRFDQTSGQPASVLVNTLPPDDLMQILWRYGEEPRARRIVQKIERERAVTPIETTSQLAEIVSNAVGGRRGNDTHPATRTFQALRIATNGELAVLEQALDGAVSALATGGRLAVISFHSLEDRMVKQFIRREAATCICPPELPICICIGQHRPRLKSIGKAIKPGSEEIFRNPRSRSALLRIAERLPDLSVDSSEQERRV